MKADPILGELWEIKDGLAEECGHDLRRLFDRLKASQESCGDRLINRAKHRFVTNRDPERRQDETSSR